MPINNTYLQMLSMLKQGANPQQLVMSMLQNNVQGNPMLQNLLSLAQRNDTRGIEQIARNIAKEKGMDFDKEFNTFRNNLGL